MDKKYAWMPSYSEEVKLNQMQNEILIQEREYQDADYSSISVDDDVDGKGSSQLINKLLQ